MGDKSDNIPGVPGIGAKGASDMLGKHGTLEGLFRHLDDVSPKQRALLEQYRDQALESRNLARMSRPYFSEAAQALSSARSTMVPTRARR